MRTIAEIANALPLRLAVHDGPFKSVAVLTADLGSPLFNAIGPVSVVGRAIGTSFQANSVPLASPPRARVAVRRRGAVKKHSAVEQDKRAQTPAPQIVPGPIGESGATLAILFSRAGRRAV